MNIFVPDYYSSFSCTASSCRHSCCIGWEIDIDENTLKYYQSVKSDFGKRLCENIKTSPAPHFILAENERCPFLNQNNLCDIFINLGEDSLCQICSDHPRFRNFFDTRTEIGLGLTCEEAARIILSKHEKTEIISLKQNSEMPISTDDEIFFNFRKNLFDIVQNRKISIKKRIEELLSVLNIKLPAKKHQAWADIFLSLEHMDCEWAKKLLTLKELKNTSTVLFSEKFSICAEQLLVYFLFRHLSDAQFDGRFYERIAFCVLSVMMIDYLSYSLYTQKGSFDICDLIEISRLYSSEIEYCEENVKELLDILEKSLL